jgi:hypothetical protein
MKLTYPGTESGRSGRVHYGHTAAGYLDDTQVVASGADGVANNLQHYTRTPPEVIEIVWKPSLSDATFCDPTAQSQAQLRDAKAAITVAFAGFPVGVALTVHMTAIYEWTPQVATGVSQNVNGKARSRNSMDDVLDSLISRGFTFVRDSMSHMASSAASQIAAGFGLMPSRAYGRGYTLMN